MEICRTLSFRPSSVVCAFWYIIKPSSILLLRARFEMGDSESLDVHSHWWKKGLRKASHCCGAAMKNTGVRCCHGPQWKNLVSKFKREGRSIIFCNTKPPTGGLQSQYDPLSYSQNFDEGCWRDSELYPYKGFSARFVVTPTAKPGEENIIWKPLKPTSPMDYICI